MSATFKQVYTFVDDALDKLENHKRNLSNKGRNLTEFMQDCYASKKVSLRPIKTHLLPDSKDAHELADYIEDTVGFGCHNVRGAINEAQTLIVANTKNIKNSSDMLLLETERKTIFDELNEKNAVLNKIRPIAASYQFSAEVKIIRLLDEVYKKGLTLANIDSLAKTSLLGKLFTSKEDKENIKLAKKIFTLLDKIKPTPHTSSFYYPEYDELPDGKYAIQPSDNLENMAQKVQEKQSIHQALMRDIPALNDKLSHIDSIITSHVEASRAVDAAKESLTPTSLWESLEKDIHLANGFERVFTKLGFSSHYTDFNEVTIKASMYQHSADGVQAFCHEIDKAIKQYKKAKKKLKSVKSSSRTTSKIKLSEMKKGINALLSFADNISELCNQIPRNVERSYRQHQQNNSAVPFSFTIMMPLFIASFDDSDLQLALAGLLHQGGLDLPHLDSASTTIDTSSISDISAQITDMSSSINSVVSSSSFSSSSVDFGSSSSSSFFDSGGF